MSKVTMCIDCNEKERMSLETFLCKQCLTEYVNELRKKYGRHRVSERTAEYKKWEKVANENGISSKAFANRVFVQELSLEVSATRPIRKRRTRKRVDAYAN